MTQHETDRIRHHPDLRRRVHAGPVHGIRADAVVSRHRGGVHPRRGNGRDHESPEALGVAGQACECPSARKEQRDRPGNEAGAARVDRGLYHVRGRGRPVSARRDRERGAPDPGIRYGHPSVRDEDHGASWRGDQRIRKAHPAGGTDVRGGQHPVRLLLDAPDHAQLLQQNLPGGSLPKGRGRHAGPADPAVRRSVSAVFLFVLCKDVPERDGRPVLRIFLRKRDFDARAEGETVRGAVREFRDPARDRGIPETGKCAGNARKPAGIHRGHLEVGRGEQAADAA